MSNAVIGLLPDFEKAEDLVASLTELGFESDDISVIAPDDPESHIGYEKHSKAPEGVATGAAAGGILGGAIGLLAGAGIIALPAGPFLAAGPVMAALAGIAAGTTVGGVSGGLIGLGIPEYEAKHYEQLLTGCNILVAVRTEDREEAKIALEAFAKFQAKELHCVDGAHANFAADHQEKTTSTDFSAGPTEFASSESDLHSKSILTLLDNLEKQARQDAAIVEDPKACILMETTAEVCLGLKKAFEEYRQRFEGARPL